MKNKTNSTKRRKSSKKKVCSPIFADRSTESRRESNSLGQTNYNKLNKRKCCVEAGQDERLTKKGQSIYTLPHMYANRKVGDTQKRNEICVQTATFFTFPFVAFFQLKRQFDRIF